MPISVHHRLMRIMVWNMRWMTRYAGFIARPMVRLYGSNEIIACGLRELDDTVSIIFTPGYGHTDHRVVSLSRKDWVQHSFSPLQNFSGTVVKRFHIPDVEVGMTLRMKARKANRSKLSSPKISVKEKTMHDPELLSVSPIRDGAVRFDWEKAELHDPMIYFLAVENDKGETLSAIYTRETFWEYPATQKASYSVGPIILPALSDAVRYTAKLVLVDYDGWVSHVAIRQF